MMRLFFPFLIGVFTGLRSLTPPAATAWAAHLGWLKLEGTLSLIGSVPFVVIFSLLAAVELFADKLPRTPNRTSPMGLSARIVTGALAGACVAAAGAQGIWLGVIVGVTGAVAGAFGGYQARTRLVTALGVRDIYGALLEDLITIAGSLWIVSQF